MMSQHDSGYKLLFSHPRMVQDLLTGFVHEQWVAQLDFTTLEKVSSSFVSDDLRDREDDVIWRVRWGEGWLYVYLLIEFQSRPDIYMAVRIMTYLGLLYQELIKQKKLTANNKLPPVLPLVLYNGNNRWTEASEVAELVERIPGGLEAYIPRLRYLLLDEGALDESPQWTLRNLSAALFRLEKSQRLEDTGEILQALSQWLAAPEQTSLRRAFTVWIKRVLLPGRLPGVAIPEVNDLNEVSIMLAENTIDWTAEWRLQGMQQGMQQGELSVLTRQLTRRFGELPLWAIQRLNSASLDELDHWADRVLDAASLEDVLND